MNETLLAGLGITAGLINLLASIPYFLDIFRGNTKPERATWWMWFSLSLVGFFGQLAGGARWSLVLALSSTIVAGVTALLSIKYGYGRFHRRDGIALLLTAIGIALSLAYNNPLIVIGVVVAIEVLAGGLTLYKTWYSPLTESFTSWRISTVGVTCGLLAVGNYTPAIFLSPLSNFLINISMVLIIFYRRRKTETNT